MVEHRLGPYRIIGKIGTGGMAAVFKAVDPREGVNRKVAVKVLYPQLAANEEVRERFMREMRVAANLEHLHILPVYDYGTYRGVLYIVMRLMEHGSLQKHMRERGILPLAETTHIVSQVASALTYAQSQGVIHRDLKPGNVLLDSQANVYLTDFGLAQLLAEAGDLTTASTYLGTPAYSSVEQCQGNQLTHASDIYSLGIITFEMLTGRLPFTGPSPLAVLNKHINDPLPDLRRMNPKIPSNVIAAIIRATAKNVQDRYPTAQDFADALQEAAQQAASTPDPLATLFDQRPGRNAPPSPATLHISPPPQDVTDPARRPAPTQDSPPSHNPGILRGHTGDINALSWSPDGARLASASHDRTVRIWDAASGTTQDVLTGHTKWVSTVTWSPNGLRLASGGEDGTLRIWEVGTPGQARLLNVLGPFEWIWSAAWSLGGDRLAFGCGDGSVRIWEMEGPETSPLELKGHGWDVLSVAWSPEGARLASTSFDQTVRIWQVDRQHEWMKLENLHQTVHSVAWAGQHLAGGSEKGTIYIWQIPTTEGQAKQRVLDAHTGAVRAIAWAAGGQRLASGSDDSTCRVWDAASGAQLTVFGAHKDAVRAVAWHPEAFRLASAGRDGAIHLWDAP